MNIEDPEALRALDRTDKAGQIARFSQQLLDGWNTGMTFPLLAGSPPAQVLLCGTGEAAHAADLLAAYIAALSPAPVVAWNAYGLPAWAGQNTWVILAPGWEGNEETRTVFEQALSQGCRLLVVGSGGDLASRAQAAGAVLCSTAGVADSQSVGWVFSLLLAVCHRLGLLPDPSAALHEAAAAVAAQHTFLAPESPAARNPAKRQAGQWMGRVVAVFGADLLAPAARYWKAQINKTAKAWAQWEELPAADHDTAAGMNHPDPVILQVFAMFLQSTHNHPRNQIRLDFTRQIALTQGINTDIYQARGEGPLAHLWTAVHFGAMTAYYLAAAYQEDPTPAEAVEMLKQALAGIPMDNEEHKHL